MVSLQQHAQHTPPTTARPSKHQSLHPREPPAASRHCGVFFLVTSNIAPKSDPKYSDLEPNMSAIYLVMPESYLLPRRSRVRPPNDPKKRAA